jgi:hypothetical protein
VNSLDDEQQRWHESETHRAYQGGKKVGYSEALAAVRLGAGVSDDGELLVPTKPTPLRHDKLRYGFCPVPDRAFTGLRRGEISHKEFTTIAFLYARADYRALAHRAETPVLNLWHISEGVQWAETMDALSKHLLRLSRRPERWFTFRGEGGRGIRAFTLYPEAPSEEEAAA